MHRIERGIIYALLLGLLGLEVARRVDLPLAQAAPEAELQELVRAKRVEIVGADGEIAVVLTTTPDEAPSGYVEIRGTDGRLDLRHGTRRRASVDDGFTVWGDTGDGPTVLGALAAGRGGGAVTLFAHQGQAVARLGATPDPAGPEALRGTTTGLVEGLLLSDGTTHVPGTGHLFVGGRLAEGGGAAAAAMAQIGLVANEAFDMPIFEVYGTTGDTAAAMWAGPAGGAVNVNNELGDRAVFVQAFEDGGVIGLHRRDGELTAQLSAWQTHGAQISLSDGSAEARAVMGFDGPGEGAVLLNGRDGENLVSLGSAEHGAYLNLNRPGGSRALFLQSFEARGVIGLHRADGTRTALIDGWDGDGALISLSSHNEKSRCFLGYASPDKPFLSMRPASGSDAVLLTTGDYGGVLNLNFLDGARACFLQAFKTAGGLGMHPQGRDATVNLSAMFGEGASLTLSNGRDKREIHAGYDSNRTPYMSLRREDGKSSHWLGTFTNTGAPGVVLETAEEGARKEITTE